jgi:hypothetical protein
MNWEEEADSGTSRLLGYEGITVTGADPTWIARCHGKPVGVMGTTGYRQLEHAQQAAEKHAAARAGDDCHSKTKWTTDELTQDYDVIAFAAPFCIVVRRSDNVRGSMQFARDDGGVRRYSDFRAE